MRNGLQVMDCDRHVLEPRDIWDKYLDPSFKHYIGSVIPRPGRFVGPGGRPADQPQHQTYEGDPYWRGAFKNAVRQFFDNRSYLQDMDREGVDVGVLFSTAGLSFPWYEDASLDLVAAQCCAYNDWLYDYCSIAPDRMLGMAIIPLRDTEAAKKELRRAVGELGMAGVFWRPNAHFGRRISDPSYEPIFALAQELNVPIGCHEGNTGYVSPVRGGGSDGRGFKWFGSARLDTAFSNHAARHPTEQMGAFIDVASEGVLDRFPDLRFAFLESGCGWLPYWLERLDVMHDNPIFRESYRGKQRPSDYFRRGQCFVSCEAEEAEEGVPILGRLLGENFLMWASDYPHPDAVPYFPNTVGPIVDDQHLSLDFKRRILWDNPRRFYGLDTQPRTETRVAASAGV
ncbi:MAG TPA: amidohydrolase family protein [Chloroflexota bacterium]|nr:amidohydrolase family protein [Chloroflexota bacterium]